MASISEREFAIALSNKILDRVSADPDDDLAVLSRQFLRSMEREQRLVDICFDFAIASAKYMQGLSNHLIAKWVCAKLKEMGFPTKAQGISWGVLTNNENEESLL